MSPLPFLSSVTSELQKPWELVLEEIAPASESWSVTPYDWDQNSGMGAPSFSFSFFLLLSSLSLSLSLSFSLSLSLNLFLFLGFFWRHVKVPRPGIEPKPSK